MEPMFRLMGSTCPRAHEPLEINKYCRLISLFVVIIIIISSNYSCIVYFSVADMVRTYVRKKPPPAYSKQDLENAIDSVRNGHLSMYRASKTYKIPKATLFKHIKGLRGVKSKSFGRPTAIPYEEEKVIAENIKIMEKWGFGLSKKEVLETIGDYVNKNKISTPFKNGIPGDDYFMAFKSRFCLSLKKPQNVEVARKKSIDPFIISEYFNLLKDITNNLPPSQIYNIDETSFCLDPTRIKVVGEIGTAAHRATSGPGKENISVLLGGNAAGEKLPPMIVFKGKNVWDSWIPKKEEEYPGISYGATKNGWMEAEIFFNYFVNNLLKHVNKERPIVIIYDGHSSHISIKLVEKARQENIILLKLPPHTSHILQPMDLCVFKPLKLMWDENLTKWQRKNYGNKLPKSTFSSILSKIWLQLDPAILQSGFKKAGIVPFSDSVIPAERYEPQLYKKWCDCKATKSNQPVPTISSQSDADQHVPSTLNEPQDNPVLLPMSLESEPTVELQPLESGPTVELQQSVKSRVSFEDLLLEKVKQASKLSTKRKRVCRGAEVITSLEAINKLRKEIKEKEQEKLRKKEEQKQKKERSVKKYDRHEKSSEEEDDISEQDVSSDSELEDEQEIIEQRNFEKLITKNITDAEVKDWIIVKFICKKSVKMFVAQIIEKEDAFFEAKFARRIRSSSTFHWPEIEDTSIVLFDEVFKLLPPPKFDKRGKFTFDVSFGDYNIG